MALEVGTRSRTGLDLGLTRCQISAVFEGAASGGHLDLLKWAVEEDPTAFGPLLDDDDDDWDQYDFWSNAVSGAADHGHLHILRYIVESLHGGNASAMQGAGLHAALYCGHVEVLAYLVTECGLEVEDHDSEAAEGLYSFIAFKWLYEQNIAPGLFDEYEMCQQLFENAACVGNREFIEWGRTTGLWDPDYFYECEPAASEHGHRKLAAWLEAVHFESDLHECPACSGSGQVMEYMVDEISGGYA